MYHIKNDKRCLASAKKIGTALRALLRSKPLEEISITDIQKMSGTGRSTFYRLFDNIDDVILYMTEEELLDLVNLFHILSWQDFTSRFIEGIISGSRELTNIAESGKMHIISKAVRTNLTREAELAHVDFDNTSRYMIAIFVGSCISLVTAWEEGRKKESTEDLARIMSKVLNYKELEAGLIKHERNE